MIVALNRSVVMAEVIQWARYQLAGILQCPLEVVTAKVEQGDKGLDVSFAGPGMDDDGSPDVRLIFHRMMLMAQERLEGLKTRRAK
jgi:hypothetical protein